MEGTLTEAVREAPPRREPSEEGLARRALGQGGEAQSAFADLVRRHERAVLGTAEAILGERMEAEDVAQETFLELHTRLGGLDLDRPLRPWLLRVAANRAKSRLRRFGPRLLRRSEPLDGAEPVSGSGDSSGIERDEAVERLGRLVDRLPSRWRQAFLLHYREGMGLDAVSEVLGAPIGTVKSDLHRARKRLAAEMEGETV